LYVKKGKSKAKKSCEAPLVSVTRLKLERESDSFEKAK